MQKLYDIIISVARPALLLMLIIISDDALAAPTGHIAHQQDRAVAVSTNLMYDALAVPDIGLQFAMPRGVAVSLSGMYAWWSRPSRGRYWRLQGGELSVRKYFGRRLLGGHHLGVCSGVFRYDFCPGDKGQLSGGSGSAFTDHPSWSAGVEYGYSFTIGRSLRLDLSVGGGLCQQALYGLPGGRRPQHLGVDPPPEISWPDRRRGVAGVAFMERRREMILHGSKIYDGFKIINVLSLSLALGACENQQDLCLDHSDKERYPAEVVFDWSGCPEADPQTMSLYLFPADGSHFTRHEFSGRDGGRILVTPGHYSAVAVNSDNGQVRISNTGTYRDFTISLRDAYESQGLSRVVEKVCEAPGPLWTAWIDDIVVSGDKLMVAMGDELCHCSVEIRHLGNAELVRSVTATLAGANASVGPDGAKGDTESVRLQFTIDNIGDDRAYGEFLSLGHCGLTRTRGDPGVHELGLCFTLGDGSERYCVEDVTEQVHRQMAERCHIVIDSIDVPVTATGGMNMTVDEWDIINIPVTAN